jgi:hypothetical protein
MSDIGSPGFSSNATDIAGYAQDLAREFWRRYGLDQGATPDAEIRNIVDAESFFRAIKGWRAQKRLVADQTPPDMG